MKLNIYEGGNISKVYETDSYDLMFGTVEDIADAVNLDKMKTGSDKEVLAAVIGLTTTAKDTVKDLIKDIFPGITDEEIRHTKVREQAAVLIEVINYTFTQIKKGTGTKN